MRAVDVAEGALEQRRAGGLGRRATATPANLSTPRLAIVLESSAWSAAQEVHAERPGALDQRPGARGLGRDEQHQRRVERDAGERLAGHADRLAVADRGHHGDAGGEPAEHVAEPAGRGDRLRVVGWTALSSPGRNSKSKSASPSQELISSGLGQVSRASGLIPSGIVAVGLRARHGANATITAPPPKS